MDTRAEIRKLVAEWAKGGSDGPSWEDLLLKMAVLVRDEAIKVCHQHGAHDAAIDIARRIKV